MLKQSAMNILANFLSQVKGKKEDILRFSTIFLIFLLAFGLGFLISELTNYQELKFEYEHTTTSGNYY